MVKPNVGGIDRFSRAVIAVSIGTISIYYSSWWGLLGILPAWSFSSRYCPVWAMFGISTYKSKESKAGQLHD
jgi:hypothetical protein